MSCVKNQPMEHPSLPVRGAWIEIKSVRREFIDALSSLPVRGAWIEIKNAAQTGKALMGRSPCGERGLKSPRGRLVHPGTRVAPRAGSVD